MQNPLDMGTDRRVRLRNMQLIQLQTPELYAPSSTFTQFVSTNDNIGNYMPVLAIQEMLGETTDCWNMHRKIDWDFVNKNYRFAVIGGAGLLHKTFSNFWDEFEQHCKLPFVIWGVGVCEVDSQTDPTFCSPDLVIPVFDRAEAINVRDELTAKLYAGTRTDVDITECPTVFYLRNFANHSTAKNATLVIHPDLVSETDHSKARATLELAGFNVQVTDNIQTQEQGLVDIIDAMYSTSTLVVTSRLHGAISAYALGIPYVALAGDEKLREFARLYGGGESIDDVADLDEAIRRLAPPQNRPEFGRIESFGARVRELAKRI